MAMTNLGRKSGGGGTKNTTPLQFKMLTTSLDQFPSDLANKNRNRNQSGYNQVIIPYNIYTVNRPNKS